MKLKKINRIKRICGLFKSSCQNPPKSDVTKILNSLTVPQQHLIYELIFNIIYNSGFADMTTEQKSKLAGLMKPFENDFRFLADKGNSLKNKKNILVEQTGTGIFTSILAVVIPSLIGLLTR